VGPRIACVSFHQFKSNAFPTSFDAIGPCRIFRSLPNTFKMRIAALGIHFYNMNMERKSQTQRITGMENQPDSLRLLATINATTLHPKKEIPIQRNAAEVSLSSTAFTRSFDFSVTSDVRLLSRKSTPFNSIFRARRCVDKARNANKTEKTKNCDLFNFTRISL